MDFKTQHLGPLTNYAQHSEGHHSVTPGTQTLNENSWGVQKVLCELWGRSDWDCYETCVGEGFSTGLWRMTKHSESVQLKSRVKREVEIQLLETEMHCEGWGLKLKMVGKFNVFEGVFPYAIPCRIQGRQWVTESHCCSLLWVRKRGHLR